MEVVVGSKALEFFGVNRLPPKDLDIWTTTPVKRSGVDSMVMPKSIFYLLEIQDGFCSPNTIYTIKCSHLGWDIHWQKTKLDVIWLYNNGCEIIPELYNALTKHWKVVNGDKLFLSLSRDKREFFNDHVTYVYDHDYLHELVAFPDEPMYKRCLKDGEQVLIDKNKFQKLSLEDQVRLFREEISSIAIERWMVNPKWKGKFSFARAYEFSLKKTIVSLTKNWATDFIVTHLDLFYKVDLSYFNHANIILGIKNMSNENIYEVITESLEGVGIDGDEVNELITEGSSWGNTEIIAKWVKDNNFEHIAQEGGGEGGAEYCYAIFKFKGKTYKFEYNYYSHQGYSYDYSSCTEVFPVQKTITVYE